MFDCKHDEDDHFGIFSELIGKLLGGQRNNTASADDTHDPHHLQYVLPDTDSACFLRNQAADKGQQRTWFAK